MNIADRAGVASAQRRYVVVSLDFELRWGIHDVYGLDFQACRNELDQARHAVPELLKLLIDHRIRATWAAVGAIGCSSWDDYFSRAPQPPRYVRRGLAIDPRYAELDRDGELHFAPELMKRIASSPGQYLGTHTFSHLYLRERGVTASDVAADLAAAADLHEAQYGTVPLSLVFPRNQCAFLDVVRASTVRIWRGNQDAWYYEREDSENYGLIPRVLKLADELNPLSTRAAPMQDDMTRASLFLRLSLPAGLWRVHMQRIKRELRSLRPGEIFHVWFHPDNLGQDTALRLSRVEQLLELVGAMRDRGEIESCAMEELLKPGTAHHPATV